MSTPDPRQHACPECGKHWATPSASDDCCGAWLELDDYSFGTRFERGYD